MNILDLAVGDTVYFTKSKHPDTPFTLYYRDLNEISVMNGEKITTLSTEKAERLGIVKEEDPIVGTTREWAQYLDALELDLIRRTLLRHISDATWCSDEEASTLTEVARELGEEMTRRETVNLHELYEKKMFRDE